MSTPPNFSLTDPFANIGLLSSNPLTLLGQDIEALKSFEQSGLDGILGYVSPSAKATAQAQLQAQLTQAGMNPTEAEQTANTTVTQALIASGADPSQMPWYFANIKLILVLIAIGFGLYLLAPFARR